MMANAGATPGSEGFEPMQTNDAGPRDGERTPAGEDVASDARFSADAVASSFEVDIDRVHRAMAGEFQLGPDDSVTSVQAQGLADVLLGDLPIDRQQAAMMTLGAFTPRSDDAWGMGDTAPGEESDRLSSNASKPDDVSPSPRGSHDPAYTPGGR